MTTNEQTHAEEIAQLQQSLNKQTVSNIHTQMSYFMKMKQKTKRREYIWWKGLGIFIQCAMRMWLEVCFIVWPWHDLSIYFIISGYFDKLISGHWNAEMTWLRAARIPPTILRASVHLGSGKNYLSVDDEESEVLHRLKWWSSGDIIVDKWSED